MWNLQWPPVVRPNFELGVQIPEVHGLGPPTFYSNLAKDEINLFRPTHFSVSSAAPALGGLNVILTGFEK